MIKNISKFCLVGLVAVGITSCDPADFGDTNVNPNATTTPIAGALLTSAINSVDDVVNATQGQHYVQYLANSQYTSADTYQTVEWSYGGWYSGPLMDLNQIIKLNTDEDTKDAASAYGSNANQIAVAQILQSFYYMHITDRWGDIPFSESLQINDGVRQPKFDTQESVYSSILTTLATAQGNISSANPVTGDILFGGDMDMWKKFANTIRLTMALRLSEVDPAKGSAEFNAAMNDGVIALDNSENIFYTHLANQDYDNPWEDRFETRRDYCVAEPLVDLMQTTANGGVLNNSMDPRLPVYADPTEASGNNPEYVGMVYGVSEAEAGSISNTVVSFLGSSLREQAAPTYIFTAAQVLFSMAEAAELGWIADDSEQLYYDGIMASLEQYGVEDGYASYISNSWVQFDAGTAMDQILSQKYIANFLNGYEAWSDWRRTGIPALLPAPAAQNESGEIPVRQAYPVFERDLNADNYDAVVARQGADGLDTKVWWDK
ncbi:SusD/RagB family nutrient-binding outer membrane lipoprotein [Fulvivirga sedimenti]|uniref:SusD/RagB family nutrient-binding outer membrane lipoprotein n=1 Tax=Fulvivirga sedimenti TaxID=2879465 RepID=A0A9X1HUL3_9BACT|nr:SusD/RagB family nutrient-binding outer membrane lipoprotein [Fulvivirga sedimenti]MCA6078216.1 SusD/RagB family nutrient-binding outer membrane lipoprotein [Fulvivirga sedimenti]